MKFVLCDQWKLLFGGEGKNLVWESTGVKIFSGGGEEENFWVLKKDPPIFPIRKTLRLGGAS